MIVLAAGLAGAGAYIYQTQIVPNPVPEVVQNNQNGQEAQGEVGKLSQLEGEAEDWEGYKKDIIDSMFPDEPNPNGKRCDTCPETYIARKDIGFIADDGNFTFYDCRGLKYILFTYLWRPNGGICASGGADLMKFENGKWKIVQKITTDILENNPIVGVAETKYEYGIWVNPDNDKIIINKVKIKPENMDNFSEECDGKPYKMLNWNKETCRFE